MGMLEFLLLFMLIFQIVYSDYNTCPSSSCGDAVIDYPFKSQGQEPGNNCTYVNLRCDNEGILSLSLPFAGDFYVSFIQYYISRINLYDPGSCLLKRLMDNSIDLSSSPFMAKSYDNYTFYTCPVSSAPITLRYGILPIDCLSNSTYYTVATSQVSSGDLEKNGCKSIRSSLFPVMYTGQFDYAGIYSDLILMWNVSDCEDCGYAQAPPPPPPEEGRGEHWRKFILSPYFIPSFLLLVLFSVSSILRLIQLMVQGRNEANAAEDRSSTTAVPSQPSRAITGLDDSNIDSYTEMVVLGNNESISGNDYSSCAICLEAYNSEEEVRRIAKCGHFFHSDCIVLWLKKNNTCPVCRTSLSDVQI